MKLVLIYTDKDYGIFKDDGLNCILERLESSRQLFKGVKKRARIQVDVLKV